MVRNVSFKSDDVLDDKLYSEAKKRGITKSAFIKQELGKIVGNSDVNLVEEKKNSLILDDIKNINVKESINKELISNDKNIDLFNGESKKEQSKELSNTNIPNTNIPNTTIRSNETKKPEEVRINFEQLKSVNVEKPTEFKQEPKKLEEIKYKHKFVIKSANKLLKLEQLNLKNKTEEHTQIKTNKTGDDKMGDPQEIDIDGIVNEKVNKILNEKEFNKRIKDMHDKIVDIDNRVCEDGKCTKEGLSKLEKEFEKLKDLDNIKKNTENINNKIKETDICPDCGEKNVPFLSSFCPDCGTEIHGWTEKDGTPVKGWKPYKDRVKK